MRLREALGLGIVGALIVWSVGSFVIAALGGPLWPAVATTVALSAAGITVGLLAASALAWDLLRS